MLAYAHPAHSQSKTYSSARPNCGRGAWPEGDAYYECCFTAVCCEVGGRGGPPTRPFAYIHFARCSHRHSHSSLGPSLRPTHLPQCLHCNVPCAPHTVNQRAMCSAHGHRMTWSVGKPAGLCRRHDHASTPGSPYAWGVEARLPRLSRLFPSQRTGHCVYARGAHNTCCARCG